MAELPEAVTSKIQASSQGAYWSVTLGETRYFRAYCCNINAAGIMGVAKEPVIVANIEPTPICLTEEINWDISGSYAPGSTLTAWEVDFGDDTAAASGSDFPNDTTSGTHTYAEPGTYKITITLTEGLGKDQDAEYEVEVEDCAQVYEEGAYAYASTDGAGVFFIDWNLVSPVWQERNTGLEGDALKVRSLVMNPRTKHLPALQHELWAATKGGLFKTTNGGWHWAQILMPDPSNIEFGDTPAATADELDWFHVVIDPTDDNTVYVLAGNEQDYP